MTPADQELDKAMPEVEGVLFCIHSLLRSSGRPVAGAAQALNSIRRRGIAFRLLTGAAPDTSGETAWILDEAGFDVSSREIISGPMVAAAYVGRTYPGARCYLVGDDRIKKDMEELRFVETEADVIIMAIGSRSLEACPSAAIRMLADGASLVSMHPDWLMVPSVFPKTRSYDVRRVTQRCISLAEATGRPSREFFRTATQLLGAGASGTALVCDDARSDILAAQRLGLTAILLGGVGNPGRAPFRYGYRPDRILGSLAELPGLLGDRAVSRKGAFD